VRKKLNKVMTQECEHKELIVEEDKCREKLSMLAKDLDFGTYNLIQAGLREFEVILKARPKKDSKRAQSDLEFALWKTIESRAGGKLDMRNSGQEQTNGKGLTSLQNCHKVFDALLGMYPPGDDVHVWIKPKIVRWQRLGNSLYDVGRFLKSQKRGAPRNVMRRCSYFGVGGRMPFLESLSISIMVCFVQSEIVFTNITWQERFPKRATRASMARSIMSRVYCIVCHQ